MPYRPPGWRIAVGLVISLLLHVLAVVFLRLPQPHHIADSRTWLTQVEVRIVPPPAPAKEIAPEPERVAMTEPRRQPRRTESRKNVSRERTEMSLQPARESTLIVVPADPGPAKTFDREAARAAARDIAAELGPAQPVFKETREEKLARQIQSAARPNCKDGIPGGLLAPLYLLMDKKDSGCKW